MNNSLAKLRLPDSVTGVGSAAFAANKLEEIRLGKGLKYIGDQAFYGHGMPDLTIPATVSWLGDFALSGSSEFERVRFAGDVPAYIGYLVVSDTFRGGPQIRYPSRFSSGYTASILPSHYPGKLIASVEVIFDAGQAEPTLQVVDVGDRAEIPIPPVRAAQTFNGWFNGPDRFDFSTPLEDDLTLTARFTPTPVTVPTPVTPAAAVVGLAPKISGDPREGKTLVALAGKVAPSTSTFTYQWRSNGAAVAGATRATLRPGKAQAGTRISVTITARSAHPGAVSRASAATALVSSAKRRIHVSASKIAKGQPVTVTATGFKARQIVTIALAGTVRFTGRADARGIISRRVTFSSKTKAGRQTVLVTSLTAKGKRDKTLRTSVRYR